MRQRKRPNIVFILVDQWRRDAIGAYGNTIINTPNVDKIAERGVRFDQCICPAPVCAPVRASIITGRFPSCHGVKSLGIPLPKTEVTFTEALQSAGYHTAVIGKLHLVPKKTRRAYLPHPSYGFETMMLAEGEMNPTVLGHFESPDMVANCPDDYNEWLREKSPEAYRKLMLEPYEYRARVSPCTEELHQSTWVADRALDFLDRHTNDGRPFYLNVSFFDPHPNFDPPLGFNDMYDWRDMSPPVRAEGEHENRPTHPYTRALMRGVQEQGLVGEEWLKMRAAYYGLISLVDKQVGRIHKRLDELGLLEDTLIVFCSDHGEMAGDHDLVEKGPYHYDPAIRVPLILSWPGVLQEKGQMESLVQHVDLAPTFLEAAEVKLPNGMQGMSLIPVAEGERPGYEQTLTEDYGMLSVWSGLRQMTVRTQRYRYTHHYKEPFGELYDLQEDPFEFRNLYKDPAYQGIRVDLQHALVEKMIEVTDPLPPFETDY